MAEELHEAQMDPRFLPAVDVVKRTGAREFQMRWSDDEHPTVWIATAGYSSIDGTPRSTGKINAWKIGAGLDPLRALFALCDSVVDGATCAHCGRPAGFIAATQETIGDRVICWWLWDAETNRYVQQCQL